MTIPAIFATKSGIPMIAVPAADLQRQMELAQKDGCRIIVKPQGFGEEPSLLTMAYTVTGQRS